MPSSGSFVSMYLAELHFGNGYMEIGLLISSLHNGSIERSGISRGGGCSLIVVRMFHIFAYDSASIE